MANTQAIAAGYLIDTLNRDEAEMQQGVEDLISWHKEQRGGTARRTTLTTISSGAFAPTSNFCMHTIDGEGGVADDLVTITATGIRDGFEIGIRINSAVITVKNSGNIVTTNGQDLIIATAAMEIFFRWDNTLSKWVQQSHPDALIRLDKVPGALPSTALTISSGSVTPTRGFHTITSESGTADDLDFAVQTNFPTDTMIFMIKATAGHTINVRYNQSGSGKFLQTAQVNETLTGDRVMIWARVGTTWVQVGSHGFDLNYLVLSGGRLTPSSTVPVSMGLTGQGTGYLLPYGPHGDRISLFDGTNWNVRTFVNPSLAFANSKYTFAWRFAYDNAGVVTLEDQTHAPVTKTINAITAANPAVATTTANHLLNVGDWVFIDGVVGTMGTTAKNGVNSTASQLKPFKVLATPTATTFSFGLDTTGLTYTSGGTMYQCPAPTALASQNGVPVKTGDATRRLVGAYMTGFTAGQCDNTADQRMVVSALNQVTRTGAELVMSNSHTTNSNGVSKLADLDLSKRKIYLTAITDIQPLISWSNLITNGAAAAGYTKIIMDALDESVEASRPTYGLASFSAAHGVHAVFEPVLTNTVGLHAAAVGEATTAANTATFGANSLQAVVPW